MKLKRGIIFILITALCVSCNYLDFDETNNLNTREDVYRYFGQVEQVLTTVYSYMPQDLGAIGGAMRDCATDDAEFGDTVLIFKNSIMVDGRLYKQLTAVGNYILVSVQLTNS